MIRKVYCTIAVGVIFIFMANGCSANLQQLHHKSRFNQDGISFLYDTAYFKGVEKQNFPKMTMKDNGTDIPENIGPSHTKYLIRQVGAKGRESSLTILPIFDSSVIDYDKEYSVLAEHIKTLRKLLKEKIPLPGLKVNEYPDYPGLIDNTHSFISKAQYIDFPWGKGIIYLTQYTQETNPNPINNEELTCVFHGITNDMKYLITAYFSLSHPKLPNGRDDSNKIFRDKRGLYLSNVSSELNTFSDNSFTPPIDSIKLLLESLSFQ